MRIMTLLPYLTFVALGILFSLLERIKPTRAVNWRPGLYFDLLGLAVVSASAPLIKMAESNLLAPFESLRMEPSNSPILCALLVFVVADFARYATHTLMHTAPLWHIHRFHHSPTQLYWFSGNRGTPAHIAMSVVPQVALVWYTRMPLELLVPMIVFGQVMNNLMHTDWDIDARWQRMLEWVITTPRYHAIHHSTDPSLAGKNIASIFTVWDRLFGTYVNPDHVELAKLEFGADVDAVPHYRMVLGV